MSDKLKMVPIEDIDVGERFREDLGDIAGLTESITEKGVLQPITICQRDDGKYTLLAGGRRITAAAAAGLTKIPALIRDQSGVEDTEVDLREVELIENTFRKDFTWDEQVKLIARLDTMCRENNSDWSVRKTAKILGHSHPMNVNPRELPELRKRIVIHDYDFGEVVHTLRPIPHRPDRLLCRAC